MSCASRLSIGVAFKPAHFEDLREEMAAVDFLEVHAENYLGDGGAPHRQLQYLSERQSLTIHGVGLSLGGDVRPDSVHLARIRHLLQRYPAQWFSEHLAWSSHASVCLPDLLPVSYDEASLSRVTSHVQQVQEFLGRRILIENPSTYLPGADPAQEAAFIAELAVRSGCGLLLDLNNAVVSCRNHGTSPEHFLQQFPLQAVAQFHLAGHRVQALDGGGHLRIDDHASPVGDEVLSLYVAALREIGPRPTLIEWDQDVPPWPRLRAELDRVRSIAHTTLAGATPA